jgi:cupin superfamily acireductone dioxygenase involved in methionine salvage
MTVDLALIIETWECVKPSVNVKERDEVCANLVRVFDEHGMVDYDEVGINECDKHLRQAIEEYFEVEDHEEDEEDWD